MKKVLIVGAIVLSLLGISGCGASNSNPGSGDTVAVCTDKNTGERIEDSRCGHSESGMGNFVWYYMLANAVMPRYHQPVYGGSYSTPSRGRVFRGGVSPQGGKQKYTGFKPYIAPKGSVPKASIKQPSTSKKKSFWSKLGPGSAGSKSGSKSSWGSSRKSSGSGFKSFSSSRRK